MECFVAIMNARNNVSFVFENNLFCFFYFAGDAQPRLPGHGGENNLICISLSSTTSPVSLTGFL